MCKLFCNVGSILYYKVILWLVERNDNRVGTDGDRGNMFLRDTAMKAMFCIWLCILIISMALWGYAWQRHDIIILMEFCWHVLISFRSYNSSVLQQMFYGATVLFVWFGVMYNLYVPFVCVNVTLIWVPKILKMILTFWLRWLYCNDCNDIEIFLSLPFEKEVSWLLSSATNCSLFIQTRHSY